MNFDIYSKLFENSEWDFEINISDIWNKYSNGNIDIKNLCISYKNTLLNKKNEIIAKFGEESWKKLDESAQKLSTVEDEKSANSIFDDIYDWADDNEVLIKTYTENEDF